MPDLLNSRTISSAPANTSGKIGPGRLVLVVGPSGAGKDTLMNGVRAKLAGSTSYVFARRLITRPEDGETENHECLERKDFEAMVTSGRVGLAWEAHGLGYVIPERYDDCIRAGHMVIANGSRRALPQALAKYQHVSVLLITAPIEILASRLAARGRETRDEIERRLARANLDVTGQDAVLRIENTGTVEEGVEKIRKALAF